MHIYIYIYIYVITSSALGNLYLRNKGIDVRPGRFLKCFSTPTTHIELGALFQKWLVCKADHLQTVFIRLDV